MGYPPGKYVIYSVFLTLPLEIFHRQALIESKEIVGKVQPSLRRGTMGQRIFRGGFPPGEYAVYNVFLTLPLDIGLRQALNEEKP